MAYISSYSHVTVATVPRSGWDEAWFSIASWKAFLQAFPGLLHVHLAARELGSEDIRFQVATTWEHAEQRDAWAASQWAADHLLTTLTHPAYDVTTEAFDDFS